MIAIVIPNYNNARFLAPLLKQIGQYPDTLAVLSDAISDDNSLEIALGYQVLIATGSIGRGAQLRRGARWTRGADWIFFLHADSKLPEGWMTHLQSHIENHSDKAAYFNLKLDSSKISARFVEWMVRLRCSAWALPYGDQGLLISRQLYDEIGGYSNQPLFEDVDIIENIGRERLRTIPAYITTSAEKYERDGFLKRGWKNFKLLRRYQRGEAAESLMDSYS